MPMSFWILALVLPNVPDIDVFFPKSGLPHLEQNNRVTVLPLSEIRANDAISPEVLMLDSANIAPVVWPAPLIL